MLRAVMAQEGDFVAATPPLEEVSCKDSERKREYVSSLRGATAVSRSLPLERWRRLSTRSTSSGAKAPNRIKRGC